MKAICLTEDTLKIFQSWRGGRCEKRGCRGEMKSKRESEENRTIKAGSQLWGLHINTHCLYSKFQRPKTQKGRYCYIHYVFCMPSSLFWGFMRCGEHNSRMQNKEGDIKKVFFSLSLLFPVTILLFMDFCKGGRDKGSNKGIRAEAEEAEATEVQSL